MKPGTSSTGCPSPLGASINKGSEAGSRAISSNARGSNNELSAWVCPDAGAEPPAFVSPGLWDAGALRTHNSSL